MKKGKLKTITLGSEDDPEITICVGHVDIKTFNEAFDNEGWYGDEWDKDRIEYEYWVLGKSAKGYHKSEPGKKNAVPVTVAMW